LGAGESADEIGAVTLPALARSSVALDSRNTRCIVMEADDTVMWRLNSYMLRCARTVRAYELRGPATSRAEAARCALDILDEHCCYCLFDRAAGLVKIGFTSNVFRRWAGLEAETGTPLQLVAVWQTDADKCRALERRLHERFAAARQSGEWFTAGPVLSALREVLMSAPAASMTRHVEEKDNGSVYVDT